MQSLRVFPPALLLALGIGPSAAETFYNRDGVQLSATARVIDPGAATCRIRDDRHTAEEYERLKSNDGQPLDVWRVELVVANYSGKVLDYLNAHLNVESDWPPCDHWDGPEGSYGQPVVWTGPLMSIQDVGNVKLGEEVRETAFVLAYHDREPALGRWDIDYDFAVGSATVAASDTSTVEERRAPAAARNAQAGRTAADFGPEQACAGKTAGASCWMKTENQPGCHLWIEHLNRSETVTWSGECAGSLAQGNGSQTRTFTAGRGSRVSRSATGYLRDGKRHGHWTIRYDNGAVSEGPYRDGVRQGHWTVRDADGVLEEGSYLDGEEHGHWTQREKVVDSSGGQFLVGIVGWVEEGPYVHGKRHGHWTRRAIDPAEGFAGGTMDSNIRHAEGPYVEAERHGHWILRKVDGTVSEGSYVHGEKHGFWTDRNGPFLDPGETFVTCFWNDEYRGAVDTCPP